MRVLTQKLLRLRRLPGPDLLALGLWIGVLGGLEVYGRRSSSDLGDGLGVALFAAAALLTWLWHAQSPLALVEALIGFAQAVRARAGRLALRTGFDLRAEPPLPRGLPPLVLWGLAVLLPACALLVILREPFPDALRAGVTAVSHALWIVLLAALWTALTAVSVLLFCVPLVYVEALTVDSPRWSWHRRKIEAGVGVSYLTILILGCSVLPSWVPLTVTGLFWVVYLVLTLLPGAPELRILWQTRDPRRAPAVMRWSELAATTHLIYAASFLGTAVLLRGDLLAEPSARSTPITALLGLVFVWTFAGAYAIELLHLATITLLGRLADPAKPVVPRAFVEGVPEDAERLVRVAFGRRGFAVELDPRRRRSTDLPVVYVRSGQAEERLPIGTWPLFLGPGDLEADEPWQLLARRDEILCRRALNRGLRRIFKAVARRSFDEGAGFWLAPHLWFVTHVSRDVDEEQGWFVGPSYRRAIPAAARAHLHRVLAALEIDLLFVEDGVGFRRLQRVFAMLFEFYDIFGGQRPMDERHLTGLPGIRAVLHDFVIDEPLRSVRYPEPDYEDLGRARILHVFRDRGEDEEVVVCPPSFDHIAGPRTPVGVGGVGG